MKEGEGVGGEGANTKSQLVPNPSFVAAPAIDVLQGHGNPCIPRCLARVCSIICALQSTHCKKAKVCLTLPSCPLLPLAFYRDMDCQHIQGREQYLTYVLYRGQVVHSTNSWESTLCLTPPLWLLLPLCFAGTWIVSTSRTGRSGSGRRRRRSRRQRWEGAASRRGSVLGVQRRVMFVRWVIGKGSGACWCVSLTFSAALLLLAAGAVVVMLNCAFETNMKRTKITC